MAEDKKAKRDDKPRDDRLRNVRSAPREAEEKEEADVAETTEAAEPPPGLSAKSIILFIILPLFLIVGAGSAAYFTGLLDKIIPGRHLSCESVKEGDTDFAACNALQETNGVPTPQGFLDVPNIIVNLNSTTKQPRFLKISLKIELDNAEEQKKLEPILPRVIDQFQMYLRELRVEDLRGTSGIYRMKIELLSRVRAAAPDVKIRDVLFQEILVQ